MTKPDVDEILTQLYLRLNGYFTSGLILHSPTWGQNRTELDCLAIRLQYHRQQDRIIASSNFLNLNDGEIDLLFCEVKHNPEHLNFNDSLKTDEEAVKNALRWIGLFREDELDAILDNLIPLFQDDTSREQMKTGFEYKNCRIRSLLCSPPLSEYDEDKWCLIGTEICEYIDNCFNPSEIRDSCSTRYNFHQWGYPFSQVVEIFKDEEIDGPSNVQEIYSHLLAT